MNAIKDIPNELRELKKQLVWQSFNVRGGRYYNLNSLIYNSVDEDRKASIIVLDFEIELTTEDFSKNKLASSKNVGYFKYLPSTKGINSFSFEIYIPKQTSKIKIGLSTWKNNGSIYSNNVIHLSENKSALNFEKKLITTAKNNHLNIEKSKVYRNRWLLEKQTNYRLKNHYSYRLGHILVNATKSLHNIVNLPITIFRLWLDSFNFRRARMQTNTWINITNKSYKRTIKTFPNNTISLSGKIFILPGEKKHAALIKFEFDNKRLDIKELISLGFRYSEKIGFYYYLPTEKDGETNWSLTTTVPANIKKVTIRFMSWYNNQNILIYLNSDTSSNNDEYVRNISQLEYYTKIGEISKSKDIFKNISNHVIDSKNINLINEVKGNIALWNNLPVIPKRNNNKDYEDNHKVAMFLHASLPFFSNGYATRSHGVLISLSKYSKYSVEGVTRVGFPWDVRVDGNKDNLDIVEGIKYHHLNGASIKELPLNQYLEQASEIAEKFLSNFQPSIVHSASAYSTALPVLIASRKLGVPFVYEVRGLWEVTKQSTVKDWDLSQQFKLEKDLETLVAKNADRVITLTQGLKDELIKRGVKENNIVVIPNSIDHTRFRAKKKNQELAAQIGLKNVPTIGYIGSIVDYEGLDDLLDSLKILKRKKIAFNLLLVGDGKGLEKLKAKVKELHLNDEVYFIGRVEHNLIEEYYSLVDIAPFPRKALPVCEMVSPLKPFEAMALEKAILSSDVQALKEIVQDNKTGLLFEKNNIEDLAKKLELLMVDTKLRKRLATSARLWVTAERTWEKAVKSFDDVYDEMVIERKKEVGTSKLKILVYGDLNLNYVDGSAIWAVSIVEVLSGLNNIEVDFLLKANLSHNTLVEPLLKLTNVNIIDPLELGSKKVFTPEDAVSAIEKLHSSEMYDAIVLRGFDLCSTAANSKNLNEKIWPYLTDIPQHVEDLTVDIRHRLEAIAKTSETILCQTKYGKEFLNKNIPGCKDKTILLQPMIPDSKKPEPKKRDTEKIKIVYAGKFAPLWGSREMFKTFNSLKKKHPQLELHIFGDKIHNPPEDPTFKEEISNYLENTDGVVWYGKCPREEVLAKMPEMDIAWAWRVAELEMNTHELSTKVLEYGSAAIPTILMANDINVNLLGKDYPLFSNKENMEDVLEKALFSDEVLSSASKIIYEASQNFTFSNIRKKHFNRIFQQLENKKKQKTVLFAGHDLKFIDELINEFKLDGYNILLDKWTGHNKHDEKQSQFLLEQADIVVCEWCMGNAVWYSKHKKESQKLIVRFHRQEIETEYPREVALGSVNSMIFVGKHYQDEAIKIFGWKYSNKFSVIANYTIEQGLENVKADNAKYNLGIVGIVPKMKRLDKALDILEKLREKDDRYQLFIKGKTAKDFPWMKNRPDEMRYYEEQEHRIESSPYLKGAVHYDGFGKDMPEWYKKIGFVLSTSDFESFHLTIADGASTGSIPIITKWEGSDEIYPKEWSLNSVEEASEKIFNLSKNNEEYAKLVDQCKKYVQKFSLDNIYMSWLELIK